MRYPVAKEVIRVNPDGDMPRGADAFGIDAGAHLVPVKKRTSVKERRALASPQAAADYLRGLADSPVERFVVVPVDQKNRPLGAVIASQGALNEAVVGMREVFAPAVEARAAAIIVAHNHPSGDSTPSQEDVRLTERLMDAGRLLGIPVLDHLVIGDRVTSLRSIAPGMFSGRAESRVAERRGRRAVRKNPSRPRIRYADLKRLEAATWPSRWTDGRVRVDRTAFESVYKALGRKTMAQKFAVLDALYRLVDHEGRARLGRDFKLHLAGEDSRAGRHRRAVWHARTRRTNPPTKRQMRDLSSWKTQARLQAAAMSDWELNERAPAFLKYWVPSMRSRMRQAATALRQVREANPRKRTRAMKIRGQRRPYRRLLKRLMAGPLAKHVRHAKKMTRRRLRLAKRRNPWPAFLNGVAGGAGFFAANTALGAITRANGKKRRRRRSR